MTQPFNAGTPFATALSTSDALDLGPAKALPADQNAWARWARPALNAAATSWFVVAVLGQLMLAVYVVGFYWRAAAQGQPETWNEVLPRGYIAGDTFGNLVVAVHLAFAVLVTVGGPLQLIPAVRKHWPTFHRWNGRAYLASVLVMSVGGLTMIANRGGPGDMSQTIGISVMALLIIGCSAMAVRHARARRLDLHRQWALRLFLVVSGGWFFRVGLMFWIVLNQGPVGFDPDTFRGPFISFLSFAQYLVPLAVLELYFRAQKSRDHRAPLAMAAGLGTLTLSMAVGIVAATLIMWWPRL